MLSDVAGGGLASVVSGSRILNNFHGRHMCIIPNLLSFSRVTRGAVHSTLRKFSQRIVYIIRTELFIKCWNYNKSSNTIILDSPQLIISNILIISVYAQMVFTSYNILFTWFPDMIWSWKLHWGYPLINKVAQYSINFVTCLFLKTYSGL